MVVIESETGSISTAEDSWHGKEVKCVRVTGQLKGRGGPGRPGLRKGMRQRGGATGRGAALTGRGAARGGVGARGEQIQDFIYLYIILWIKLFSSFTQCAI